MCAETNITDRTARNDVVIDPTKNVLDTVNAVVERQDALRAASEKYMDMRFTYEERIAEMERRHATELRDAEAKRIDSIRQVDVAATKTEADRALQAIQTLAATTNTNAENLRTALNTTAQTIANQTAQTIGEITTRIAALEKSSYEGVGKSGGGKQMWGFVVAGVAFVLLLIQIYTAIKPAAPPVIYAPQVAPTATAR